MDRLGAPGRVRVGQEGRVSNFDIGVAMFVGALVLIALRMPVGAAMLLVGGLGLCCDQRLDRRC